MYEVIETFIEKNHENFKYIAGKHTYPADGYKSTKKRVTELQGNKNKYKRPFLGEEIKASDKK
ncbi:hypothetical protein SporoP37_01945 [Sporosarcina sp. P37]|uniref:hypothetical protein n=1 Tax=unclassified Sporosarcina TaxID=2647733 RepID=UPI000A17D9AB|nr:MULTISPECIES: hypothetical protein [unclassified Sporosarcina]ARK23577.1 hypothetical protein SporoP37_01945 [Sporosarcina sp. P37]PID18801.1 hypothetical protein CSV62_06805 [Sporosarcina sp. P35]